MTSHTDEVTLASASASTTFQTLQFSTLQSQPTPSFWSALTALKLDRLKLDDAPQRITGWLRTGRYVRSRANDGSEDEAWVGGAVMLDGSSLNGLMSEEAQQGEPAEHIPIRGVLKNFNTIEEFRDAEAKKKLFNELSDELMKSLDSDEGPPNLCPFLLVTFADLKTYVYHYWFAFPALVHKPAWEVNVSRSFEGSHRGDHGHKESEALRGDLGVPLDEERHEAVRSKLGKMSWSDRQPVSLVRVDSSSEAILGRIEEWSVFFANTPPDERLVLLNDPTSDPHACGWPLRNALFYLRHRHGLDRIRAVLFRPGGPDGSRIISAHMPPGTASTSRSATDRPTIVGWERNLKGALTSRMADLGSTMDPTRLANQAVDLNLKLMRWRIMPSLNLEKIASTKCLLLGAGTLGCYVARCLMGWGVRNITLVDSSRVSYSNPVRQPLFTMEDCLNGGKPKAECAASRLKEIFPGVNARGIQLSIPMPGHPVSSNSEASIKADVEQLESLIDTHDAVFLLMDSRESRWLPTTIASARGNKIVLNAALGFDSWLVMRHGAGSKEVGGGLRRLGCYYCNDIVAPADSLTDRTLDQMCTVTRPGIAPIAAASAVELLVSLLQHPKGIHAAAERADSTPNMEDHGSSSTLGLVPHQLRGFLGQWKTMLIDGPAYDKCTACSEIITRTYNTEGLNFLLKVFNEPSYLERLTGLDKVHEEGEAAMEAVEWDDDEEEEEL